MSKLKIGWASRDVSTDKPIPINGQAHIRISEGIIDPITSTALVLDDGGDCAIFVSLDMVSIRCGLVDEVRAKTKALRPEIPAEKILMNATHAHTGASHYTDKANLLEGSDPGDRVPLSDKYPIASGDEHRAWLSTVMAEMIAEAWDKRAEGGIAYGYGYAVVGHSRRVCYFDDTSKRGNADKTNTYAVNGHSVMYGNTNDDMFSHYEAGADHFVNLLYTFDKDGNLTGAVVNVPCPSQNSEHEWKLTADYWCDTRAAIRKTHGNIFILPQCAAAGDLSPRVLHYKKAQDRRFLLKYGTEPGERSQTEFCARKDIAERIAAAFDEVLSWAKKDIRTEAPIRHTVSTVELSRYMITEEDKAAAEEGLALSLKEQYVTTDDPKADIIHNTRLVSNRSRFRSVLRRYEEQKTQKKLPMEMHVIRVGDIAFASNRYELFMDYMHRIQARSPFEQTFIVQLCGQPGPDTMGGYLPTQRAFEGRGYSAIVYSMSISPEGGQELVNETVRQLKQIKEDA